MSVQLDLCVVSVLGELKGYQREDISQIIFYDGPDGGKLGSEAPHDNMRNSENSARSPKESLCHGQKWTICGQIIAKVSQGKQLNRACAWETAGLFLPSDMLIPCH